MWWEEMVCSGGGKRVEVEEKGRKKGGRKGEKEEEKGKMG